MTAAEYLMDSLEFRMSQIDIFGIDPHPSEPFSYALDEPSLLLHTLRHDFDDIRRAHSLADANEIWEKTRSFVLTFHVGQMN